MGSCFGRDPNRGSGHELVPIKRHATWPRTAKAVSLDEYEFATWDLRRSTSHNQRTTTFRHPVTGQVSPENSDFFLQEQHPSLRMTARPPAAGGGGDGEVGVGMEQQLLRPSSAAISETSTSVTSSTVDTTSTTKVSRSAGRVHSFGKRDQAIKRNPNVPVVVRGWLYKQDSSGMRLWKRKWFVLADYCLFYYKDSREESVLGSIPLPSYVVSPVGPEDHISRKYAFKASHTGMRSYIFKQSSVIGTQAEHSGMRTYYFSADTQEDMNGWLRAMNQAALMHNHTDALTRPPETSESTADALDPGQALPQQTNHVNHRVNAETPDPETAQPVVHEVLLEPIHHPDAEEHPSLQKDTPTTTASSVTELPMMGSPAAETDPRASLPADTSVSGHHVRQMDPEPSAPSSAAGSRAPSRAPSRAASTLPPAAACTRNGLVSTPSPILEPNGIGAGTYLRTPPGATLPPADLHNQQHRRSTLEEVQQWVHVQRAEHKGPPSRESTLPRRTPPTQPKFSTKEAYQTLPKTSRPSPPPAARLGEYKYAQDRLSHFRLTPEQQTGPGGPTTGAAVWQLYEWQQRHQFRHGSPTAPLYTPAPDYPFGTRPPSAVPPSSSRSGTEGGGPHPPRCVSVPPTAADIPPPGPPSRGISPMRRPHTPADRVTVMPMGERSVVEVPFAASPRRTKSQLLKAATIERRSMPPTGYITHTVSAPSLHGKTADDTYVQLKRDLEYLDLKVFGSQTVKDSGKPVKVAESDVDVKLSQLCEQDKTLQELEANISSLKEDKDKLESVLDVSHQQMEQYQDQPAHSQKIAYQQRLLQEDLVAIRAQISRVSTEMSRAWEEYGALESSVEQLRRALQAQMNNSTASQQEKAQIKRELWRIEDVMGGLSASKANYKITISSVHNPERKLVPSVSDSAVPSQSAKLQPPHRSSQTLPHSTVPKWAEESAPPRPPLPRLYDYEDTPPVIPPLPKEASVIRHTSVRGLKRQSDERKRDRETGQGVVNGDCKVELRSYLSEPELPGLGRSNTGSEMNYQTLPSKGLSGSSSRLNQPSSVSSYVTLRRGVPGGSITRERPRSALERLSSPADSPPLPGGALAPGGQQQRGRMTAEEQLERMKRHQRALVRERKRNLSQGERSSCAGLSVVSQRSSSSRLPAGASDPAPSSVFDGPWREGGAYQLEERLGAEGQSDEGRGQMKDRQRIPSDQWVTATATPLREVDVEPDEYDLDFSLELGRPRKVPIPERYVESDPEEPLSQEELDERSRKAQRMRSLLAKSSAQNFQMSSGQWVPVDFSELDSVVQQQERIMTVSHALASEASRKSKLVAGSEWLWRR